MGFFDKFFEPKEGESVVEDKTSREVVQTFETSDSTDSSAKVMVATDDIVQVAYERFGKKSTNLFKVEEIAETLKGEPDESKRNSLIRQLLIQFGNNLEDLRAEATFRMDEIKRVQTEYQANYQERSEQIAGQIASKQKALEELTAETNRSITELKTEEESNAARLASNEAGAQNEINRLNKIMLILMETEG